MQLVNVNPVFLIIRKTLVATSNLLRFALFDEPLLNLTDITEMYNGLNCKHNRNPSIAKLTDLAQLHVKIA